MSNISSVKEMQLSPGTAFKKMQEFQYSSFVTLQVVCKEQSVGNWGKGGITGNTCQAREELCAERS